MLLTSEVMFLLVVCFPNTVETKIHNELLTKKKLQQILRHTVIRISNIHFFNTAILPVFRKPRLQIAALMSI